jgi:uncharacterized protein (TIGR03086 family)
MSHDWITLHRRAGADFARRFTEVDDWSEPRIRGIVTHVLQEQRWVPHLLAGRTVAQAQADLEPLRDDLPSEWDLYSFAAAAAWKSADVTAPVRLAGDTVPALEYLREQVAELAIHTWDLSHALGVDDRLDDDLVAAVWSVFEPQREALTASGVAARVDDDAPLQVRMLALTGRSYSVASVKPICAMVAA